jgi:hypothetical protein
MGDLSGVLALSISELLVVFDEAQEIAEREKEAAER